jgi:hypothetical protein
MLNEVHVLSRIEPYVRHDAGQEDVLGQPKFSNRDRLVPQIPDRVNLVRRE